MREPYEDLIDDIHREVMDKMIKKVLVLEDLIPPYNQLSEPVNDIEFIYEPGALGVDDLIKRIKIDPFIQGIICSLNQEITADVFHALPQLRVIANIAVGLNNIDLSAAKKHGVKVAHTPKVLTDATADLAWALLLGGVRRLAEGDRLVRSGQWRGWAIDQLLGTSMGYTVNVDQELTKKRLGIIGLGQIGQAIARRAKGFNLDVVYHNRTPYPQLEQENNWSYLGLEELLSSSDYVVLALALTQETHHILDKNRLKLMRTNAYLVNVGRGALIDEMALIDCLESGHLSGAALDVYEYEPKVPQRLKALPQVTLSPHLGSATIETRQAMSRLVIESAKSVLMEEKLKGYFVT